MKTEKINKEKKASQHGVFGDVISDKLKQSLSEAEELLDDLQSRNQKMMLVNFVIMLTADSFSELETNTEKVETICRKFVCTTSIANYLQEECFASVYRSVTVNSRFAERLQARVRRCLCRSTPVNWHRTAVCITE